MNENQPSSHAPAEVSVGNAALETGAALASAAAFGLFGAVIGKAAGSMGDSARHNLSAQLGKWVGAITLSVLSLYASFRNHQNREATLGTLQKENAMLKRALENSQKQAAENVSEPKDIIPEHVVERASHEGVTANRIEEKAREMV